MAWIGLIDLDTDKNDVGVATGIWNKGLSDEFIYSRRAKMTTVDKNAFVAEAKAALLASQTKAVNETAFNSTLTTALNS